VKLEEAEKKIDSLREGLSELKENYQQKELNLKDLEKKKEKIRVELKELPFLKEKLAQEEQVLNSEQVLKDKILEERGGYQSKFDQCFWEEWDSGTDYRKCFAGNRRRSQ
jgi:exonuclease SbcC